MYHFELAWIARLDSSHVLRVEDIINLKLSIVAQATLKRQHLSPSGELAGREFP
jgi:hypothetical protein